MMAIDKKACEHPFHVRHEMRVWDELDPANTTGSIVYLEQCGDCRGLLFTNGRDILFGTNPMPIVENPIKAIELYIKLDNPPYNSTQKIWDLLKKAGFLPREVSTIEHYNELRKQEGTKGV